jgi:predicted DNA-binding protein (MmcQ/YjbR family)
MPFLARTRPSSKDGRSSGLVDDASRSSNGAGSPARLRWDGAGRSLHFLADPTEREALRQDGRFVASPHHGDRGWFGIRLDGDLDWKEMTELLDSAYQQATPRRMVES